MNERELSYTETIMENTMEIAQESKARTAIWYSDRDTVYTAKWKETIMLNRSLHSIFIAAVLTIVTCANLDAHQFING